MSCNCNCNPCQCGAECDPANEPLASALDNFTNAFFGQLTKTCINGKVVWVLPCDLESGIPGFPRNPGEGIACYIVRLAESGAFDGQAGPPGPPGPGAGLTVLEVQVFT